MFNPKSTMLNRAQTRRFNCQVLRLQRPRPPSLVGGNCVAYSQSGTHAWSTAVQIISSKNIQESILLRRKRLYFCLATFPTFCARFNVA